jgi:mRNA-degrading endonuclease RelE of RelBE toxin-antitoxin system
MALYLTRTFQKRFHRLPKDIQPKVEAALLRVYSDPLVGKKLLGDLEGEFSMRVGAYRIIYSLDKDKNVWAETVRHRKEVYSRPAQGIRRGPAGAGLLQQDRRRQGQK